jgi:hypothetical protein
MVETLRCIDLPCKESSQILKDWLLRIYSQSEQVKSMGGEGV